MSTNNEENNTAVFGGGCFWCLEAVFSQYDGVRKVTSGYAGGSTTDPGYEEVCTGTTGHAEVIRIDFDPDRISYEGLLDIFWKAHDPTTLNRQGADVGTQYRSIIFYGDQEQQRAAERSKQALEESGYYDGKIVTEIKALDTFYPAEEYHQDYYRKHPYGGYCSFVIRPKLKKLHLST